MSFYMIDKSFILINVSSDKCKALVRMPALLYFEVLYHVFHSISQAEVCLEVLSFMYYEQLKFK